MPFADLGLITYSSSGRYMPMDTQEGCGIVQFKHKVTNQSDQLVSSHSTRALIRCAAQKNVLRNPDDKR